MNSSRTVTRILLVQFKMCSSQKAKKIVEQSQSSGVHVFEFHGRTALLGIATIFIVALIAFGIYRLCCRRRERQREPATMYQHRMQTPPPYGPVQYPVPWQGQQPGTAQITWTLSTQDIRRFGTTMFSNRQALEQAPPTSLSTPPEDVSKGNDDNNDDEIENHPGLEPTPSTAANTKLIKKRAYKRTQI